MIKKSLFLAVAIAVVSQSGAFANPTTTINSYVGNEPAITEFFIASTYVGNRTVNGLVEVELTTLFNNAFHQATIASGDEMDFYLDYDGTNVSYYVETDINGIPSFNVGALVINELYIRLSNLLDNKTVEVRELNFTAEGTPDVTILTNSISGSTKVMTIHANDTNFSDGFHLSGKQIFSWTGTPPQGTDLRIDIFAGLKNPPSVPEPTTMALLGLSVLGFFMKRKK